MDFQRLAHQVRRSNNLWWFTFLGIFLFAICGGTLVFLRQFFFVPPTLLPNIPTFDYASPAPAIEISTQAGQSATQQIVNVTLPASTITPLPFLPQIAKVTPTNRSSSGSSSPPSSFPSSSGGSSSSFQPTPIQAFAITLTPDSSIPPPPTPVAGQSAANSMTCGNILLPARPGNQWTYIFNTPNRKGDINYRVLSVNSNQAEIDTKVVSTGNTNRNYAQCDQDTILSFPQSGIQSMLSDSFVGAVKADYVSGVLIPNEAAWLASNWTLSWTAQYRIEGDTSIAIQGITTSVSIRPSIVNVVCQTPGSNSFESVATIAGIFNAIKIVCNANGPTEVFYNGLSTTASISAQSTQWYAFNTGLLKSQTDYVNLSISGETIALNTAPGSTIELRNFVIAP